MKFTKEEYEEIRKYFNQLNNQDYHFVNSNDVCTPMECVEEMVNKIPKEFWERENLKILDPCAGNGNFLAYIMTKTDKKNLYFNEINPIRIKNIKKKFGEDINVTEKDFLIYNEDQKYDLIVANPPYAKFTNNKRTAKNHNMSRDFILKAINLTKEGGYILFIVPDNWMSFSDKNKVPEILSKYQFIYLNIHGAKKWFPKIGSSFTWFLLKKIPNENEFIVENNYKIKTIEKVKLDTGVRYIPLFYSNIVRSIINKTINLDNKKYNIQTSSNLHKYTQKKSNF